MDEHGTYLPFPDHLLCFGGNFWNKTCKPKGHFQFLERARAISAELWQRRVDLLFRRSCYPRFELSKLPFEKPTVLVVDDNEDALSGVAGMLEIECKFTVLTARSGASALKIAGEMDREIHLLLTDVNMPFMSGPELATTLERMRPDLGVVLMSGSFDGFALLSGRKWLLLHKPFGAAKLLQTVDEAISMRSTLVRTSASC